MSASSTLPAFPLTDSARQAIALGRQLQCEVIETLADLDALAPSWNQLCQLSTGSPFQTFGWNRAWYEGYASSYDQMLVFVLKRENSTVAILPAYRKGGAVRMAADHIGDLQDVICADNDAATAVVQSALTWTRKHRCRMVFDQVPETGRLYKVLQALCPDRDHILRFQKHYATCMITELPESLDAHLQTMPRKRRQNLKRHLNKMEREHPEAEYSFHGTDSITEEMLDEISAFHLKHFNKDGNSLFTSDQFLNHLKAVAKDQDSGLEISFLRLNGEILAVHVGLVFNRIYHGFLTAYDMNYRNLSPGFCLVLRGIDHYLQTGKIQTLDFLLGTERYKEQFTNANYKVGRFQILPWGPMKLVRWGFLHAEEYARIQSKRILRKAGTMQPAEAGE